jgi:NADPH-dependent ferric siderophore reductase
MRAGPVPLASLSIARQFAAADCSNSKLARNKAAFADTRPRETPGAVNLNAIWTDGEPSMTTQSVATATETDPRTMRRVRHEGARRRVLTVARVERLTPTMIRVAFGGDLEGFVSLGFDDHVKLFFPVGTDADGTPQSVGRDYTPRRYDAAKTELEIDFAIHDAGPATRWAGQAAPGQTLEAGGPRGSQIVSDAFDGHLLIADDTGLPAISRRLAELPAGAKAVAVVEVDRPGCEIAMPSPADVAVSWTYRNGAEPGTGDALARALREATLPRGDVHAWVACESLTAKALRAQLIAEHGANPKWIKAAGYWRRGATAVHETHNE